MGNQLNSSKKFIAILSALMMTLTFLVGFQSQAAQAVSSPKIYIGTSHVNGSPIKVSLTSKYKNKTVTIEVGTVVRKKLKYTRLTSVRTGSTGLATICSTRVFPNTAVLRVKYGSKVVASVKTKSRSSSLAPCPLIAPTSLDLSAASDSGVAATDNITNATALTLSGTSYPGSSVTLFDGGVSTGLTATADSLGAFSVEVASNLGEGVHQYTVKASIDGLTSVASSPLAVTVDRTKPTLNWAWEELEIGRGATVHMNIVPSEPIRGFELADITKPSGLAFEELAFSNMVQTGENYRVTLSANGYEATDLIFWIWEEAVTDLAGNQSAGNYVHSSGPNIGRGKTNSPILPLDYVGPVLASASLEVVDAIQDYCRVNFSFDEEVFGLRLQHVSRSAFLLYNNMSELTHYDAFINLSLDGVLHSTNNKDFWLALSLSECTAMSGGESSTYLYQFVVPDGAVDEYGYRGPGGSEGIRLGVWPY